LAREHLRSAHAIRRDFRTACGGNQRFIAQALGGNGVTTVSDDDVFQFRYLRAPMEQLLQLSGACNHDHLRARMIQDVGHAVRRFIEVDRDGDAAGTGNGEIRGMPFRPIGSEQSHAVSRLDAQLDQGHR